jgi:hypothetical protein
MAVEERARGAKIIVAHDGGWMHGLSPFRARGDCAAKRLILWRPVRDKGVIVSRIEQREFGGLRGRVSRHDAAKQSQCAN